MTQQGQNTMDPAVLDGLINRLLEHPKTKPGKQVQLIEAEIRQLCIVSKDVLLRQPVLLHIHAPIIICGMLLPMLHVLVSTTSSFKYLSVPIRHHHVPHMFTVTVFMAWCNVKCYCYYVLHYTLLKRSLALL